MAGGINVFIVAFSENCIKMMIQAWKRPRPTRTKEQGRRLMTSNHGSEALSQRDSGY